MFQLPNGLYITPTSRTLCTQTSVSACDLNMVATNTSLPAAADHDDDDEAPLQP